MAAKRAIRGAYRKRKRDYSAGHVKPSNPKVRGRPKLDTAPGPDVARPAAYGQWRAPIWARPQVLIQGSGQGSLSIACAIGAGKVLMWHQVDGRWNAKAAERMYSGPLRAASQKTYSAVKGKFRVMEDNDPTGYKCRLGMAPSLLTLAIAAIDRRSNWPIDLRIGAPPPIGRCPTVRIIPRSIFDSEVAPAGDRSGPDR